uniref:Uncharacterized protein n=1 Tax=Ananas comosus var. bracteatus TaxID=296719 RepID=A0A6V7NW22_ANACO|nr:unnamed protein product [Ananas comosus var. bracteatus]
MENIAMMLHLLILIGSTNAYIYIYIRRYQIPSSTDANDPRSGDGDGGGEVEAFQRHVAELLLDFPGDDVLSLSWTRKLLDVFLICLEEFRVLLFNSGAQATPPPPLQPLDRILADFFDCAVKALNCKVLNV